MTKTTKTQSKTKKFTTLSIDSFELSKDNKKLFVKMTVMNNQNQEMINTSDTFDLLHTGAIEQLRALISNPSEFSNIILKHSDKLCYVWKDIGEEQRAYLNEYASLRWVHIKSPKQLHKEYIEGK